MFDLWRLSRCNAFDTAGPFTQQKGESLLHQDWRWLADGIRTHRAVPAVPARIASHSAYTVPPPRCYAKRMSKFILGAQSVSSFLSSVFQARAQEYAFARAAAWAVGFGEEHPLHAKELDLGTLGYRKTADTQRGSDET
jgi:hypothetical protein